MFTIIQLFIHTLSAAAILIPLFLILHFLYIKNFAKTALYTVFSIYFAGMFSAVGIPTIKDITVDLGFNFIPLIDILSDIKNAILNVILFIPLGFLLPLIWEKFRDLKRTLLFGFGLSALIEILQIFTFRLTDINDLITNTAGTLIGYLIASLIVKSGCKLPSIKESRDAYIVPAAAFAVAFAVAPFISSVLWNVYYGSM